MGVTAGCILLAVLLAATLFDLRERRIPNALAFGGLAAGLLLCLIADGLRWAAPAGTVSDGGVAFWLTRVGVGQSLLGVLVVGLLPLAVYAANGGGAGDVKLAWAIGALLGPILGGGVLLTAYLLAGACGLGWFILTGRLWRAAVDSCRSLGHRLFPRRVPAVEGGVPLRRHQVPMAPFMLAGVVLVVGEVVSR